MDLTQILQQIGQFMGNPKPVVPQDPNMVGPPEETLNKENRDMKQWATQPDTLNQVAGSLMGMTGPVKTWGRAVGKTTTGKWFEDMAARQEGTITSPHVLQRVLDEHGVPSRIDGHGHLWAMDIAGSEGTETTRQWVRLNPTLKAVKSWLGY
jgi:hypothetical protein